MDENIVSEDDLTLDTATFVKTLGILVATTIAVSTALYGVAKITSLLVERAYQAAVNRNLKKHYLNIEDPTTEK